MTMQTIHKTHRVFAGLAFILTTLATSCAKEYTDIEPDDNTMVTFRVRVPGNTTPSSRALTPADESAVRAMDVLLFETASDGGGFIHHTTAGEVVIDGNREGTFSVRLPIGTFDMVLIANSTTEVAHVVSSFTAGVSTKDDLQTELTFFQSGKWPADHPSFRTIPMWAEVSGAIISGGTSITGVNLTRALASINVEVTAPNFILTEVYLYNPMIRGYIVPDENNLETLSPPKADKPTLLPTWNRQDASYKYSGTEISDNACKNEIYTFETPAGENSASNGSDITEGNTFVVIGGRYDSDAADTYYRVDFVTEESGTIRYLPLLRNHRYEVMIKNVLGGGASSPDDALTPDNIVAELVVVNEADIHYYIYDDFYYLGAADRSVSLDAEAGTHILPVSTDHPAGWTAVASDSRTNSAAGVNGGWLTINAPASGDTGSGIISYSVQANGESAPRTCYIHFTAGTLRGVIPVTQAFVFDISTIDVEPIAYGYVGAFWKSSQTGERLITILRERNDIYGGWIATVVEGSEWIILDTNTSSDPNIHTSSAADMNISDASHQVSGSATTVSGDASSSDIYFRIGLRNTIPAGSHRYGVILLNYNNGGKNHLIFVRQGEEPDHLFRPEDPTGNNSLPSDGGIYRKEARKFSPYNLTTTAIRDGDDMVEAGIRGGIWTDYPSQAGAFFKWASPAPEERRAFAAVRTENTTSNYNNTPYWDDLKGDHETCPPGYRRPNDGPTGDFVASPTVVDSEMRQSLLLNPFDDTGSQNLSDGNFYRGFLADGYFDRRLVTGSIQSNIYCAVERNSPLVGYAGQLFYNPENFASLFFPAVGYRYSYSLYYTGTQGYYWTSSSSSIGYGWYMSFNDGNVSHQKNNRYLACSVRCVEE